METTNQESNYSETKKRTKWKKNELEFLRKIITMKDCSERRVLIHDFFKDKGRTKIAIYNKMHKLNDKTKTISPTLKSKNYKVPKPSYKKEIFKDNFLKLNFKIVDLTVSKGELIIKCEI